MSLVCVANITCLVLIIYYPCVVIFRSYTFILPSRVYTIPGGSHGKESACNAGELGLILRLGRIPGERNGYPLQYSYLVSSVDRGAWQAEVHGVAKSETTE